MFYDERIFLYNNQGLKIGFITVRRSMNEGYIKGYAVNLVGLPDFHFCGNQDMRLLGFDTKWHVGNTGECHRHCICRGNTVTTMKGNECSFSNVIDLFFSELHCIGMDMDWDMEEPERIPA